MRNPSRFAVALVGSVAPVGSRPSAATALTLCAMCLALVGCGGSSLNRGANYYGERRYIDAAQVFEHAERELPAYDDAERARYGLYRGATLLELGDTNEAERWLLFGYQLATKSPGALTARERGVLREALSSARARQARHDASPMSPAPASVSPAPTDSVPIPASAQPHSTRF